MRHSCRGKPNLVSVAHYSTPGGDSIARWRCIGAIHINGAFGYCDEPGLRRPGDFSSGCRPAQCSVAHAAKGGGGAFVVGTRVCDVRTLSGWPTWRPPIESPLKSVL
eukprot:364639-Chlamydomonas_euryale.AAC.22